MTQDLDGGLALIGQMGWRGADVGMLSGAMGLGEREFRARFGSPSGFVEAALRRLNDPVYAAAADLEPEDSVRDRLFELIFARLDAAQEMKAAIAQWERAVSGDPALALALARSVDQAMDTILTLAGLQATGLRGRARRTALAGVVYGPVVRTWLGDETDDMALTMRRLDQCLERLDGLIRFDMFGLSQTITSSGQN